MDQPNKVANAEVIGAEPYALTRREVEAGLPKQVRRVALEIAAPPCTSCAHEPVCSLRLALEGLAEVETSAPPLPAGLRLSLAATVECDHFLRDRAKPAPVRTLTPQQRGQAASVGLGGRAPRAISPEGRERMRQSGRDSAAKRAEKREAAAPA